MPYEPKRTIIQMAPRNMLPGVRLHQARIGMGQAGTAICPSLEQLMGITDPNDPCQAGATLTTAQQIANLPSTIVPTVSIAPQTAVTPSLSTWASQNSGTILIVGGVLFGIAILGAMTKR